MFIQLMPFFNDTTLEVTVREYARKQNISAPTASTILQALAKEHFLQKKIYRNMHLYTVCKEEDYFENLAKIYWKQLLKKELAPLHKQTLYADIYLFGSLAKGENTKESDIDLYVAMPKKILSLSLLEKKLGRKIDLHFKEELANPQLQENIFRGVPIYV